VCRGGGLFEIEGGIESGARADEISSLFHVQNFGVAEAACC
jgi:hypothetical protein